MVEVETARTAGDLQAVKQSRETSSRLVATMDKSLPACAATELRVSKSGRDEVKDLAALRSAATSCFGAVSESLNVMAAADHSGLVTLQVDFGCAAKSVATAA